MVQTEVDGGLEKKLDFFKISPKTILLTTLPLIGSGILWYGLSENKISTFGIYERPPVEYRVQNPIDSGISSNYTLPNDYEPFK